MASRNGKSWPRFSGGSEERRNAAVRFDRFLLLTLHFSSSPSPRLYVLSESIQTEHAAHPGNHKVGLDFRLGHDAPIPAIPRRHKNHRTTAHRKFYGMAAFYFRWARRFGEACAVNRCPTHSDLALCARGLPTIPKVEKLQEDPCCTDMGPKA